MSRWGRRKQRFVVADLKTPRVNYGTLIGQFDPLSSVALTVRFRRPIAILTLVSGRSVIYAALVVGKEQPDQLDGSTPRGLMTRDAAGRPSVGGSVSVGLNHVVWAM